MRPLSRNILALALLNVVLIGVALAIFAEWQFGLSVESLVLGPARDRILVIANAMERDLEATPEESRGELLAAYSRRYGADFFLVDPHGEFLAGRQVELPQDLIERLRARGDASFNQRGFDQREKEPAPDDFPPPDGGGRGFGPAVGPPDDLTFVKVTRNPLLYWVGVRIPVDGGAPAVLLLRSRSILNSSLFFDWRALVVLAMTLAALALACWGPFVHSVTRSIRDMDYATREIAQGHFETHLAVSRRDELGDLAEQINRMAARLEGFVKNQKRFLGDIAHELCAPVARIQFALGILEQKIEDPQRTHVAVLRDEVREMSELINELLMFSKAGMQPDQAPLKCVDVGSLVRRAVAQQLPGSGTIKADLPAELNAAAHEPYLLRAISNLLRNANRYAGEEGPISVSARRDGDRVEIWVRDCGPGLPAGSEEDVFAPFYRPESARTRETGGAGLGLAIVKSCVEACRGTVVCRNRQPSGLEVTISLRAWT